MDLGMDVSTKTPQSIGPTHMNRTQFFEEQFECIVEVNFDMPYCALTNSVLRNGEFLRNKR